MLLPVSGLQALMARSRRLLTQEFLREWRQKCEQEPERPLSGATLLELTGVSWAGLERLTALDYLLSHMAWEGTCPFPGSIISDLEGTSPFRGHSEVQVGPLVRDWRERALSGDR